MRIFHGLRIGPAVFSSLAMSGQNIATKDPQASSWWMSTTGANFEGFMWYECLKNLNKTIFLKRRASVAYKRPYIANKEESCQSKPVTDWNDTTILK